MDHSITPFLFEGEHMLRVIDREESPWYVAADVCAIHGIKNVSQAVEKLDEDEKGICTNDTLGGPQDMIVVSEAGLYQLVFTSRKPVAHRFRRWLAHEVIPSIRRNGFYAKPGLEVVPAHPVEARPFPDWPMEELRTKKGVTDMYRLLYGPMAAQWIAPQLGFPSPPLELVEHGRQMMLTLSYPIGAAE